MFDKSVCGLNYNSIDAEIEELTEQLKKKSNTNQSKLKNFVLISTPI